MADVVFVPWTRYRRRITLAPRRDASRIAKVISRELRLDKAAFVARTRREMRQYCLDGRVRVGWDENNNPTSFSVLMDPIDANVFVLGPVATLPGYRDEGWGVDHASIATVIAHYVGQPLIAFAFENNMQTRERLDHIKWEEISRRELPEILLERARAIADGRGYCVYRATDEAWRYAANRLIQKLDYREMEWRDPILTDALWQDMLSGADSRRIA